MIIDLKKGLLRIKEVSRWAQKDTSLSKGVYRLDLIF
jgi:hypothetical protein